MLLRTAFVGLSNNAALRAFAERSSLGRRLSGRFVAGMTEDGALQAIGATNRAGSSATVDHLGENVTTPAEARRSGQAYHELLDAVFARKLDSTVSLKLTQMGLDLDRELAREIVSKLVTHAARVGSFVRVDMEGSAYTETTLDLVRQVHAEPGHEGVVGAVIQAYLYRSRDDVEDLLRRGIRIRLCKGAYLEPARIAYQHKRDVDESFLRLMRMLLSSPIYHGIATHDPRMIQETIKFAQSTGVAKGTFEFQMLYGIRRDLQRKLVRDGWRVRIYIPFGTEWYPYFMRRMAERPANVAFVMRNLM